MSRTHLRGLIACLALACVALGAAFAFASFRVLRALHDVLELAWTNGHVEIAARDWLALACVLVAFAAVAGAVALAIAGRRAALTLERASLIEGATRALP
jgi:hypothetical protein